MMYFCIENLKRPFMTTPHTPDVDLLYCFSGIQMMHLENEFYVVRDFGAEHLVSWTIRTPLIINFLCKKGELVGYIDGSPISLQCNEVMILLPEQTLTISQLSEDFQSTLYAMSRDIAEAQNIGEESLMYENILKHPVSGFDADQFTAMLSLTDIFAYTIQQRQHPRQREILLMLLRVNHALHAGCLHQKEHEKEVAGHQADTISIRFNRLVENHYTRQHHVGFYASKMYLTPKYLSTVVMQTSGHTAGWWIDHYIMRDAERYLQDTNMPVQQIAAVLGFSDQSAFGKYFKRQKGVSPKSFRQQKFNY